MSSALSCQSSVFSLPRASAFSPKVRIVAWSDSLAIRRRFIYGDCSETPLTNPLVACNRNHENYLSPDTSTKQQTITYRPKSGELSGRPCSAPPAMSKNRENLRVSTLNIALPRELDCAKPCYNLHPKIPPKKHVPWATPDYLQPSKSVIMSSPPSPMFLDQRSLTSVKNDFKTKKACRSRAKTSSGADSRPRDLHLSHRIAHLTQQIKDCTASNNLIIT